MEGQDTYVPIPVEVWPQRNELLWIFRLPILY